MYVSARLIPDGTKTPMKRTLFPKLKDEELSDSARLICLAAKKIPVDTTELEVEINGPIELLLAVVNFCHEHSISLYVNLPKYADNNSLRAEDQHITLLRFDYCPHCKGRFSSAFHHSCPFCGSWGYEPYLSAEAEAYNRYIMKDREEEH